MYVEFINFFYSRSHCFEKLLLALSCLSVRLPVCLSVSPPICLSVRPSIHPHPCLPICPSVRMEQLGFHWMDFCQIVCLRSSLKSVEKI